MYALRDVIQNFVNKHRRFFILNNIHLFRMLLIICFDLKY